MQEGRENEAIIPIHCQSFSQASLSSFSTGTPRAVSGKAASKLCSSLSDREHSCWKELGLSSLDETKDGCRNRFLQRKTRASTFSGNKLQYNLFTTRPQTEKYTFGWNRGSWDAKVLTG